MSQVNYTTAKSSFTWPSASDTVGCLWRGCEERRNTRKKILFVGDDVKLRASCCCCLSILNDSRDMNPWWDSLLEAPSESERGWNNSEKVTKKLHQCLKHTHYTFSVFICVAMMEEWVVHVTRQGWRVYIHYLSFESLIVSLVSPRYIKYYFNRLLSRNKKVKEFPSSARIRTRKQ